MVIRAKYAGTCPSCGRGIEVGDAINWEKGKKATHKDCKASAAPAAPAPRRGRECSCDDDCCSHGCHCDSHCVCRGGNIFDC
jgi:hypothetical protein